MERRIEKVEKEPEVTTPTENQVFIYYNIHYIYLLDMVDRYLAIGLFIKKKFSLHWFYFKIDSFNSNCLLIEGTRKQLLGEPSFNNVLDPLNTPF